MKYERRKSERAQVNLEVLWDGDKGRNKGEVIDISVSGCFVLSGGVYKRGELIQLEVHLPITKQTINIWGMVANTFPEVGFGIKFTSLCEESEVLIKEIISHEKWKAREQQIVLPNGQIFIPTYA